MNRTGSAGFDTLKSSATNMGKGVSDAGSRVSGWNFPTIQQPKR